MTEKDEAQKRIDLVIAYCKDQRYTCDQYCCRIYLEKILSMLTEEEDDKKQSA